jgi:energy-coupling factor transporter ATP-binding protein EcfA2
MKVQSINLSWFRGAGREIVLDTDSKNVVVYGANGTGKSSFSDALEYIIRKGKVNHLVQKNIGSKQEKGIVNTQKPGDCDTTATIIFDAGITASVQIMKNGPLVFSCQPEGILDLVQSWQIERLLLRQDEVASFIMETPGGKYSVLLPLLGLDGFECAADNMNKLKKQIGDVSKFEVKKAAAKILKQDIEKYLPITSDEEITNIIKTISNNYGIKNELQEDIFKVAKKMSVFLMGKIELSSPDTQRYATLVRISKENLPKKLAIALEKENKIRDKIDILLDTRIEILNTAEKYITNVDKKITEISCPACGSKISKEAFTSHVNNELKNLKQLSSARDEAIETRQILKESISRVLSYSDDKYLKEWLAQESQKEMQESLYELTKLNLKKGNEYFNTEIQTAFSKIIPIIVKHITSGIEKEPPSNKQLYEDINLINTINKVQEIRKLEKELIIVAQILNGLENGVLKTREAIKTKTKVVVSQISKDIQYLWDILHPNEPIENIQLYIPEDEDKSIDVGLKFFGVEQPSPRFTLSEGHRNSLGLCIFFALARLEKNKHLPIFLDDIVSSLDRGHRGNVTELLVKEFGERQILLFTHDREWFTELSMLLPPQKWKKLVLKPWNNPRIGMQWSTSEFTFDDAREYIDTNCELAGNYVRQIMDARMAIAAEKLKIKMPYARGDKNDHRTCVEFLEFIISSAKKNLKKKDGDKVVEYTEPVKCWQDVMGRLIVRGDRGSHTGSLVKDEVLNLITVCEASINAFRCSKCGDYIWIAKQEAKELLQCSCGNIHWRYGA